MGFFSFMENSTKIRRHEHLSNFEDDVSLQRNSANLCTELWNTFSFESMWAWSLQYFLTNIDVTILLFRSCYIQEVLAALIILSSNSWPVRLSFLFDLFAEIDASQLAYDDAMLVTQVKIVEIEYSVINICYCRWQQQHCLVYGEKLGIMQNWASSPKT